MANNKTGLDYYNTDTDRYMDIRIKRLKNAFGCSGIAVYDYILCEIYRVKGCFLVWDESSAFDVADYFGLKENLVMEIVNYCGVVGLFDKDIFRQYKVLTSVEIQHSFAKLSMFVPVEEYKNFLLIDAGDIPFYKKNKKARLFQRNVKKWYRLIKEVFKRDNYICQYCGKAGGKLEADHVIPFSKGGEDTIENLVTSCRKCNRQKRDKTVEEFKQWRLSRNE
ncbi:MAG: DUF4373 domain-containing protein [Prevotellaceae bacterium]|jgi:hypothetical protein|nr:DUF4373 domain-containing protein [Prevotellaceae bacterium]